MAPKRRYQEVRIELCSICNFGCDFCPLSSPRFTRQRELLPTETAIDVLSQVSEAELSHHVVLHVMGEALLHPDLLAICQYAQMAGLKLRLATNGSLLIPDLAEALLHGAVDCVDISYRCTDEPAFNRTHSTMRFDTYREHVLSFLRLAAQQQPRPQVRVRLFHSDANPSAIQDILKAIGSAKLQRLSRRMMQVDSWLTLLIEREVDWVGKVQGIRPWFGYCSQFEMGFSILSNGDLIPCCWDYNGRLALGNVSQNKIIDILHSAQAVSFRRSFARARPPHAVCRNCLAALTLPRSIIRQSYHLMQAFYMGYHRRRTDGFSLGR